MDFPLIDLVSDTATRPTPGMWRAMQGAPLGDEQKREDPTTRDFEARVAALLGQERALFLPSATLANQIALCLHAEAGDEVLCHESAHVLHYEGGAASILSRAHLRALSGARGFFGGDDVRAAIRADDPHFPRSRAVVVENTSNGGGGGVWPDGHFDSVVEACAEHGLALHIDGARLMNAAVARKVEPSFWGARAKTVQMCFSKGLGCPFGSVLAMPDALLGRAWRWKQALGGALRQSGVITSAMAYALDHHVEGLAEDHRRAAWLAAALATHEGVALEAVETNLVFFSLGEGRPSPGAFCEALRAHGVRMGTTRDGRVRACTHRDIDDGGIEQAIRACHAVLSQAQAAA